MASGNCTPGLPLLLWLFLCGFIWWSSFYNLGLTQSGVQVGQFVLRFRQGACTVCAAADPEYQPMPTALAMGIGAVGGSAITAAIFLFLGKKKKKTAA